MRSLLVTIPIVVVLIGAPLAARDDKPDDNAKLKARIAELIVRLGDDEFARREEAQAELAKIGVSAFDALQEAMLNDDVEIAMRARYLVLSMRIDWTVDTDVPDLQRVMKNYGSFSEVDRTARMDRVAALPHAEGLVGLCRIVCFDSSPVLAKRAALRIIRVGVEEQLAAATAKLLREGVAVSEREAAAWVRAYAKSLDDPRGSLDDWKRIVRNEQRTFDRFPERTSASTVLELLRWRVDLLRKHGETAAAADAVQQLVALVEERRESVLENVDWLMARGMHDVVDQVAERFPQLFDKFVVLQYRIAENASQRGDNSEAERIAAEALQTRLENWEEHLEAAVQLQERGRYKWCESEYRRIIKDTDEKTTNHLRARLMLSELLHDGQRDLAAAEVLQPVVVLVQKEQSVATRIQEAPIYRRPEGVKSRMHYFFAISYRESGDVAKQFENLKAGVASDPLDADLLIAMHQAKGADQAWRDVTRRHVTAATEQFDSQIRRYQQFVKRAPREADRNEYQQGLAGLYNQYAWLVSNTDGDFDEALRRSLASLEIRPDSAAFLDTLAHCYAAKGDFENAARRQARAAQLEPHTRQITRKLEEFQALLKKPLLKKP